MQSRPILFSVRLLNVSLPFCVWIDFSCFLLLYIFFLFSLCVWCQRARAVRGTRQSQREEEKKKANRLLFFGWAELSFIFFWGWWRRRRRRSLDLAFLSGKRRKLASLYTDTHSTSLYKKDKKKSPVSLSIEFLWFCWFLDLNNMCV